MRKRIIKALIILSLIIINVAIVNAEPIEGSKNPVSDIVLVDENCRVVNIANQITVIDDMINKEEEKTEEIIEEVKVPVINYTAEEFNLLCRLIEAEAKGESYQGKIAVANVVINRVKDSRFPNTITNVIYAPRQFSPVSNGAIYNTPSEDSVNAATAALYGEVQPEAKDAIYFWAKYVKKSNWIWTRQLTGIIGNHCFGR